MKVSFLLLDEAEKRWIEFPDLCPIGLFLLGMFIFKQTLASYFKACKVVIPKVDFYCRIAV
jgi:hypothetical protein